MYVSVEPYFNPKLKSFITYFHVQILYSFSLKQYETASLQSLTAASCRTTPALPRLEFPRSLLDLFMGDTGLCCLFGFGSRIPCLPNFSHNKFHMPRRFPPNFPSFLTPGLTIPASPGALSPFSCSLSHHEGSSCLVTSIQVSCPNIQSALVMIGSLFLLWRKKWKI